MASFFETLLFLSLAMFCGCGLAQHYLVVPNNLTNTTCFTLDQLAQTNLLTNGTNLTLTFQPGEHKLTQLLSIRNFTSVQMIGQNTSTICFHENSWIDLLNIDQLNIKGMTFSGNTWSVQVLPLQRLWLDHIQNLFISSCYFTGLDTRRKDHYYGYIVILKNTAKVIIENDVFEGNNGTPMSIAAVDSLSIENSTFIGNQGSFGGAISIDSVCSTVVRNSTFSRNQGSTKASNLYTFGGAIAIKNALGQASIINCEVTGNSGNNGGGIAVRSNAGAVSVYNSVLKGNFASSHGGGIYVMDGGIAVYNSTITGNKAGENGGGVYVFLGSPSTCISNSVITGNQAGKSGSGIYTEYMTLEMKGSSIVNNSILDGEGTAVFIQTGVLVFFGDNTISNNSGSIMAYYSEMHFSGPTLVYNNHGTQGGGIEAIQCEIYINDILTIHNNTATKHGGGIFLRESSLFVSSPMTISHNTAHDGGAIYAYQSTLSFKPFIRQESTIKENQACNNGGGIHATASVIKILDSFVTMESNRANENGGGFYLQQNSRVYILKGISPLKIPRVRLKIFNNSALLGGGIFVDDNTASGDACRAGAADSASTIGECFIQTIKLYPGDLVIIFNSVNTEIRQNTAQSGSAIYGGLLDRCIQNPQAELKPLNGIELVMRTVDLAADNHSISSTPLQVKLCGSSRSHTFVRKGQPFRLQVKAVDQAGNSVNATIHAFVAGVGRLKEGQIEKRVDGTCTELQYNVFSEDKSAQVELYAKGPCNDLGLSKLIFNVTFLDCTCPLGFHSSRSTVECTCECEQELHATKCFPEDGAFQLDSAEGLWVGTGINCNLTQYLIKECPFDYCVNQPVNISLNSSQQIDRQCAYNRSGVLCGECEEGLSLVLASSKCEKCSSLFLLLLIPFALAGIVLVVFILWLNVTVATGTVHGLIMYANILAANKAIFLPLRNLNFLTVFVSWLNLDLGIETCFYNGMNSQAKVLLQIAFPAYLFLLMFLIIVLSEYVQCFAKLLSNRNPVAALCTLLILTYSKLLRLIIAALQFTYLTCHDGSYDIVWLFDANVQYFSPSHIPRFVAAAVILTACALFTILLFFGQWFPHCSKWKVMKWTKNTKYIGCMDAFHAPFTPKHRYWVGLLLFALIAHNLAASMGPDTSVPVLSAGCVSVGLIAYKSLVNRVYKNRIEDTCETFFLLNVSILSYGVYSANNNHGRLALAYVSMAIAFILFVVITCYHFYKYVLKKPKIWNSRVHTLNTERLTFNTNTSRNYQRLNGRDENEMEIPAVIDTYSNESREETDPDKYITPPIIRTATRPDQLREPDLDILAPVTEEDYRLAACVYTSNNRLNDHC